VKRLQAFILAAGYGERLRPVTDHIPKPLLPVLGRPVIEIVIERLESLSVDSIGINVHHNPEMFLRWIATSPYTGKIRLFHEKTILGTGGALRNAAEFLGRSAFIVHNADILSDINLETLAEEHFSSGNTVTLAAHNYEKFNNLLIDCAGILNNVGKAEVEPASGLHKIAFTGIAIYSPDFLDFIPEGYSSVVDAWLKALASGKKIGTVDFSGCTWTDIGTPAAYVSAVFEELKKTGETIYVHGSADCGKAEIEGYAALESGCVTGPGTYLKNCVVLPETHVAEGSSFEDAIVGPDYMVRIEKSEGELPDHVFKDMAESFFQRPFGELECALIGAGGSDRKYYRLRNKKKSAVLMVCPAGDPDYERHIVYTEFFRRHSLPIPEMFKTDREQKQALFEDLGDLSLYAWLKCRRNPAMIESIYRKVLDVLITLHTTVSSNIAQCPLLVSRVFDYDHLRWETGYFAESFVEGHTGMSIDADNQLKDEFQLLARAVDAFPKAIVHRDFQSQNIMITRGGIPRVIDYQGARTGPPAYDLASVLWDPYFRLEDNMRERLVIYYIEKRKADFNSFDEGAFRYSLLLCRLQRHMQALGAYGFLSRVKGKKYFLKHLPQAMEYLSKEADQVSKDYPAIYELVKKLNAIYAKGLRKF